MKYVNLCSGIGGTSLPFNKLGYECIANFEIDKHAIKTYLANFPEEDSLRMMGDMTTFDWNKLDDFDLLLSTLPCQSFSIAGKRMGMGDNRGGLIFNMIDLLKIKKPKVFLFENVPNLLSIEGGSVFKGMLSMFKEAGYKAFYKTISAYDFGLPQNRKRLFVVGIREDINQDFIFPEPTGNSKTVGDIMFDNVPDRYYVKKDYVITQEEKKSFDSIVRIGQIGKGRQGERIYSKQGLSVTISANGGGWGAKTGLYLDEKGIRMLTPFECFRLQGFPEDFILAGSDTQLYKQAGNSVPVNVIKALSVGIHKILTGDCA